MSTIRIASFIAFLLAVSSAAFASLSFERTTLFVRPEIDSSSIRGDFKFTNGSGIPIQIVKTTTSCGCTAATLTKKTYAPGESGVVSAVSKIGDRNGRHSFAVVVRTNEATANEYLLTLETEIIQEISIEPALLSWRHGEAAGEKSIEIACASPGRLKFIAVDEASGKFKIDSRSLSDAGRNLVVVTPYSTDKGLQGKLRLQFTTEEGKAIERFVVLRILPELNALDAYRPSGVGK